MKTINYLLIVLCMTAMAFSSCNSQKKSPDQSTTAVATSPDEEWISLFDGTSFDGWRGYNRADMPGAWTIEDGAIKINGSGRGEAGASNGGDIIFDRTFKNFELAFEWKVSKGANSGVFYLAREFEGDPIYYSSPEYQILDNLNHPDAKLGIKANRQSASLYDLIPAEPQNSKPFGEWNTGGVMVYKGTVVHSQNGVNVLEYHLWTDDWKTMVLGSKFKDMANFMNTGGENQEGFIGLQDHGDDVWYRNIKIRLLD